MYSKEKAYLVTASNDGIWLLGPGEEGFFLFKYHSRFMDFHWFNQCFYALETFFGLNILSWVIQHQLLYTAMLLKKQIQPILPFYEYFKKMRLTRWWKSLSLHMTSHLAQSMPSTHCSVWISVCQPCKMKWIHFWKNGFTKAKREAPFQ